MGARRIKGVNAAVLAKGVFGRVGPKGIGRQRLSPLQQHKARQRHNEVKKSLFGTDRTIAVERLVFVNPNLKTHRAAVATSWVGRIGRSSLHRHGFLGLGVKKGFVPVSIAFEGEVQFTDFERDRSVLG